MPYNELVIVNRKIEYSKNLDKKKNIYQIVRHHVSNFLGFLVEIILIAKLITQKVCGQLMFLMIELILFQELK